MNREKRCLLGQDGTLLGDAELVDIANAWIKNSSATSVDIEREGVS